MSKVSLYAPFAGVKDGLSLLTLLQDKKELEKVLEVVKTLDEKITEVNEAIEVYGKASKIDDLVRRTQQKEREAGAALNEAVQEATKTKADAKSWADQQRQKAVQREIAATERENELSKSQAAFNSVAESKRDELAAREKKIVENEQRAEALKGQYEKLKLRYENALEALKTGVAAA